MLHGFGGNLAEWEPIARGMEFGKVISLDLVGFGLSGRPPIKYDLENQRKYLLEFMEKLNIRKAVLVGSSMGASIALWTASRSPERVAGLVLFAPSAFPGSMRHRWPGDWIYRPNALNRAVRVVVGTSLYDVLFPKSLACQALDITASYDDSFARGLQGIRSPLLLVWSRGDERVPFSYNRRYRELLPQAKFIEADPRVGHAAAGHPTPEILEGIREIASRADTARAVN